MTDKEIAKMQRDSHATEMENIRLRTVLLRLSKNLERRQKASTHALCYLDEACKCTANPASSVLVELDAAASCIDQITILDKEDAKLFVILDEYKQRNRRKKRKTNAKQTTPKSAGTLGPVSSNQCAESSLDLSAATWNQTSL